MTVFVRASKEKNGAQVRSNYLFLQLQPHCGKVCLLSSATFNSLSVFKQKLKTCLFQQLLVLLSVIFLLVLPSHILPTFLMFLSYYMVKLWSHKSFFLVMVM